MQQFKKDNKSFINYNQYCKGCGLCIQMCPKKCIKFSNKERGVYGNDTVECDIDVCIQCRICETICPDGAIKIGE